MPMINITYNPSMNDSIRDLRYRYKEIKYTHISTHLISGKTIGKNSKGIANILAHAIPMPIMEKTIIPVLFNK